jgi:hypothetical protein
MYVSVSNVQHICRDARLALSGTATAITNHLLLVVQQLQPQTTAQFSDRQLCNNKCVLDVVNFEVL